MKIKDFKSFINENYESVNEEAKADTIEVVCSDCGKKFKTTQEWFDKRSKEGKLPCRKCRFSKLPAKKEKTEEKEK